MESYLSSQLRRITLAKPEPLISLKNTQSNTEKNNNAGRAFNENRYTARYFSNGGRSTTHPLNFVRPELTVVSPKRRIRIPVASLAHLRRGSGDGESSHHSTEEQSLESSLVKIRIPGDGCFSNSSGDSDNDENASFSDYDNNSIDIDMNNNDIFDEKLFEEEFVGKDSGDDSTDVLSPVGSSQFSSFNDDEFQKLYSIESSPSLRLKTSMGSLNGETPLPLLQSLFSNKPPTLYFTIEGEKVSPLPPEVRRILKWKSSTVTPKVIRSCVMRTGFRITKKNSDWLGVWGKHMKSNSFKSIKEYQKINHFPGTFHIGRKDKLWKNFSRMRNRHGRKEFNFVPQTFILPHDISNLRKTWDESVAGKRKWIIKPPASARGSGIKVISKWNQIPKKRPIVVQKYLSKPYLINGRKFDLRIYVYVSCFDPLRVYIFKDGLVRFATSKYSSSSKYLSNKYMHLTNYSINKNNTSVYATTDHTDGNGAHKWSLSSLWPYLRKQGVNTKKLWDTIKDISIKAVICGESEVNTALKQNVKSRSSCHELFGLDILLDSDLKPWLLEVNISPSLHSNSELDKTIKGQLVKDIFNIAGFCLPKPLLHYLSGTSVNIDEYCTDNYWLERRTLSSDEKSKHTFYLRRYQDMRQRSRILDVLTPDDVLILMETEDEFSRCGLFERLLPTTQPKSYLHFFETPRYYNSLLDEWTKHYMRDFCRPSIGIALLQSLAGNGVHLYNGNQVDSTYQWSAHEQGHYRMKTASAVSTSRPSSLSSLPSIRHKKDYRTSFSYAFGTPPTHSSIACEVPTDFNTSLMKRDTKKK